MEQVQVGIIKTRSQLPSLSTRKNMDLYVLEGRGDAAAPPVRTMHLFTQEQADDFCREHNKVFKSFKLHPRKATPEEIQSLVPFPSFHQKK